MTSEEGVYSNRRWGGGFQELCTPVHRDTKISIHSESPRITKRDPEWAMRELRAMVRKRDHLPYRNHGRDDLSVQCRNRRVVLVDTPKIMMTRTQEWTV